MPRGPRCFRWWMVRPSGPAARELPLCRMASWTVCVVNAVMLVSRGWVRLRRRLTRRASGSGVSGTIVVNCLARAVAIALLFVRVLVAVPEVKVMGWLGAVCVRLLESFPIVVQKCEVLCLWEHDSTVSIQLLRLDSVMSLEICRSSVCM